MTRTPRRTGVEIDEKITLTEGTYMADVIEEMAATQATFTAKTLRDCLDNVPPERPIYIKLGDGFYCLSEVKHRVTDRVELILGNRFMPDEGPDVIVWKADEMAELDGQAEEVSA